MADTPVSRSDVDLWLLQPDACAADDLASAMPWLTPAERERHGRFVFERNRVEYLATRALVRRALSSYHPVAPAAWQFRTNAYGRPAIDVSSGPAGELRFNLANHPTLVVCAIRGGAEIGVDVEPLTRGAEILAIAHTVFAPAELAALRALPEAAQPDRALALWTLKEAYIKARGMGLSLPLDGFALSFDAPGPRISFAPTVDDDSARWTFRRLDIFGHRIALALETTAAAPVVRVHHVVGIGAERFDVEPLADA
jgi:4'-phosphopantetheinyl transferase